MGSDGGPPLSLRPLPVNDGKPKNIAEFIAWANMQPGGFRALNEKKLQEEIKAAEEARRRKEENPDAEEDEDVEMKDKEDEAGDPAKDPMKAKEEVLRHIDKAGNVALLTLDFISLLLSKQNPTQAGVTLSQQLRDMVGIGTVGADKLDDSNITDEKTRDQENTAMGWMIEEIKKTQSSTIAASAFLDRELTAEGKFWEEIMAVQKSGWAICKVPRERQTLGVRFGFSEAAPTFRNKGLAPMRQCEDGTVDLDIGRLGGVSERIYVTYIKNGKVAGRSYLPAQTTYDAPLEARVLEARNTLFAQELWFELYKEARTLAAYDVTAEPTRLTYTIAWDHKITIQLVPLISEPRFDDTLPENSVAEGILESLHLLLSHAHRHNELTRTRPMPPHISRTRGPQTYPLLRPTIARMVNVRDVEQCLAYVSDLVKTLKIAGCESNFVIRTPPPSAGNNTTPSGPNQPSTSVTIIRNILQPIDFYVKLKVLPHNELTIRGRTILFPVTTTFYTILLPPSSPLLHICRPYKEGYHDIKALADYLRTATASILADHFLTQLTTSSEIKDIADWTKSISGTSIRDGDKDDWDLRFEVETVNHKPAILVTTTSIVDEKAEETTWTWSEDESSEKTSMQDILDQIIHRKFIEPPAPVAVEVAEAEPEIPSYSGLILP